MKEQLLIWPEFYKKTDTKKERIIEYNKNPVKCKECNSIISYDKRRRIFCSINCSGKNIGKELENKNIKKIDWPHIQEEHNKGVLWYKIPQKFGFCIRILRKAEKLGLIIKIKREKTWTEEDRKKQSQKRKEFLKKNPQKHAWRKSDKFKSAPCELLKQKLSEEGISFIEEHQPLADRFYSIDIAFPDKKIGIEVNGSQHYNRDKSLKEYYENRKKSIEKEGWRLFDIHYSKIYNKKFIDDFIKQIRNNFSLGSIDYSFYIKPSKHKMRQDHINNLMELNAEKNKSKIKIVLNSGIDFSKFGWVSKLSKLINIIPQKCNQWMKKYMLDFYTEKCFKRKVGTPKTATKIKK